MSRFSHLLRGAIGLGAIGIAACGDADKMVLGPVDPTGGSIFKSYVAVGNSVTAGWQSNGLNDSTQRASYARLFAIQAGTRFAYPSFPKPGCPVPTGNWVSGKSIDSLSPVPGGCTLRDASQVSDILNNVAVPYAYAADLTVTGPGVIIPGNALNTFILGGLSQVDRALRADPTFISFWVGNNETLFPATVGMLGGPAAGSPVPPLIPASVEIPLLKKALDSLKAGSPHLRGGIVIGALRVTNTPRFFSVDSLRTAAKKTAFDAFTGKPSAILANCVVGSGYLISAEIAKAIRVYPAAGGHPPLISCGVTPAAPAPVGDIFILDPGEIGALNATTDAYNVYLKAKADTLGWAYLDPNVLLAPQKIGATPAIPAFPNFTSNTRDASTAVFGVLFALDGVNPTSLAQKLVANSMIDSVNAKFSTKLLKVP